MEQRACAWCGRSFDWDPRFPHRAYCSKPCQRLASRVKLVVGELRCDECGEVFERRGTRGPVPKACPPCVRERTKRALRHDRSDRPCADCGTTVVIDRARRGPIPKRCTDCTEKRQRGQIAAWLQAQPVEYRRDKYAAGKRRRQYRLRAIPSERIVPSVVYERDGWICQLCREPVDRTLPYPDPMSPSLDHVIRLADGGGHLMDNVQLAHLHCNTVIKN